MPGTTRDRKDERGAEHSGAGVVGATAADEAMRRGCGCSSETRR